MKIDPSRLVERLGIRYPLVGLYDAPDEKAFEPVVRPAPKGHTCVFAFFGPWCEGKTLCLSPDNFGCGGAGTALFSAQTRSRDDYIAFLADTEGLKCDHDVMGRWIDRRRTYAPKNGRILIGPLRQGMEEYLKTVTLFVNPDQLASLVIGAHYRHALDGPDPVKAPFGSGCMQLVTCFESLDEPLSVIGATDIAMRRFIPPDILAFTVTVPMWEQLCGLDERSFLYKPFLKTLKKERRGTGASEVE